ncbi:HEAT repeat domain-containing protein [Haloarchaeobius sp. HME9146]|uniref:HEAT repeat domain-containing protein n=1 Tax=Haloarchaeobius sp. HME9146 TaxID=2978732 RepID=UPI0021BEF0E4|nr:HEAT repeat domain-containing protein [Haloarchaeobius sp. HME9146]MCT9097787.1 HEAT repeat domain-containing protein [Haloarchaeobius sp. HME9146]
MALADAVAALDSASVDERREAGRELFRHSRSRIDDFDDEAMAALADATDDPDPVVRGHAVGVLGEVAFRQGEYDEPIPRLTPVLEALTDDDERVRQTATGALWNREWMYGLGVDDRPAMAEQARVVAAGLVACLGDSGDLIRKRAARTLTGPLVASHPDPQAAAGRVLDALVDYPAHTRQLTDVLDELSEEHPAVLESHVDALLGHLDADQEQVRNAAGVALSNLVASDPELATEVLERQPDAAERITAGLRRTILATPYDRSDRRERAAAADAYADVVTSVPGLDMDAIEVFISLLASPSVDLRRAAATGLVRVARGAPARVERIDHTEGEFEPAAIEQLARTVDDPAEFDTEYLFPLEVLATGHPEFVTDRLRDLLERHIDPNASLLLESVQVLERIAAVDPTVVSAVVPDLVAALDADARTTRTRAAATLGDVGEDYPDLLSPVTIGLGNALSRIDPTGQRLALKGLAAVAEYDPDAVAELADVVADCLPNPHPSGREAAAAFLVAVGEDRPAAIPEAGRSLLSVDDTDDPAWPLGIVARDAPSFVDSFLADELDSVFDASKGDQRRFGSLLGEVVADGAAVGVDAVDSLVDVLETGRQQEREIAARVLYRAAKVAPAAVADSTATLALAARFADEDERTATRSEAIYALDELAIAAPLDVESALEWAVKDVAALAAALDDSLELSKWFLQTVSKIEEEREGDSPIRSWHPRFD